MHEHNEVWVVEEFQSLYGWWPINLFADKEGAETWVREHGHKDYRIRRFVVAPEEMTEAPRR